MDTKPVEYPQEFLDLPPKRQRFVMEYLADCNGTQAAIRAGYSAKSANEQASSLLAIPKIRAAVDKLLDQKNQEILDKYAVTKDRVIRELALLAFSNQEDYAVTQPDGTAYVDLSKLTRDQWAAIQEIITEEYVEGKGEAARDVKRVKIKLADKGVNLERLGRTMALFSDKTILQNPDGTALNLTVNFVPAKKKE